MAGEITTMSTRPFILRFAVKRGTREANPEVQARYDDSLAMTVIDTQQAVTPIIAFPDYAGMRTKKEDIEKGEDNKDRPTPPPPPRPRPKPQ